MPFMRSPMQRGHRLRVWRIDVAAPASQQEVHDVILTIRRRIMKRRAPARVHRTYQGASRDTRGGQRSNFSPVPRHIKATLEGPTCSKKARWTCQFCLCVPWHRRKVGPLTAASITPKGGIITATRNWTRGNRIAESGLRSRAHLLRQCSRSGTLTRSALLILT